MTSQLKQRPKSNRRNRLFGLIRKELRETLRDRRTLITLILMPLLVYPLLSLICQKFLLTTNLSPQETTLRIGVVDEDGAVVVRNLLESGGVLARQAGDEDYSIEDIELFESPNIEDDLAKNNIDLGLKILDSNPNQPNRGMHFEFVSRENSPRGEELRRRIGAIVDTINRKSYEARLTKQGEQTGPFIAIEENRVKAEAAPAPVSLAALVPLVLILMTITGAVYPAIDCTAGERERGTLETLVAAPTPRLYLLLAKYVAVVTVAILTATVNLLGMTITISVMGLGPMLLGDAGFSFSSLGGIFALMILFASFFSALLLAICCFARSFKEAQAYLIPVMLLSIGPGLVSLTPGVELTGALAAAPLINIVLLGRDVMTGSVDPMMATVAIVTTIFYALAAISMAARVFGSDAVLYGASGSWNELWQRPGKTITHPRVSTTMFFLAVLFPLYFLSSNLLAQTKFDGLTPRLFASAAVTALLFAILPTLTVLWSRAKLTTSFALGMPPWLAIPAALLLAVSLWPLAHEAIVFAHQLGIASLSRETMERGAAMFDMIRETPLAVKLFALALVPAVCEEWFFRGFLQGSLQKEAKPWQAILSASLLFGVFHVLTSTLSFERMIPSTIIGLILGLLFYKSGSIWPGILLHTIHNGLIMTASHYPDLFGGESVGAADQIGHLPWTWIAGSIPLVILGLVLVWFCNRSAKSSALSSSADLE